MKLRMILPIAAAVALAAAFSASAQTTVTEIIFNEDGVATDQFPNSVPPIVLPGGTVAGFPASSVPTSGPPFYLTGLGTMQYSISGAGLHDFVAFVDDEADYVNGPFNDSGAAFGAAPSYLSWEIGNPGPVGDNAFNSAPGSDLLDDANDTPAGNTDISTALGFDFTLAAGQTATINLALGTRAPGGFYLQQSNDISGLTLYYSGSLTVTSTVAGVPDNGATWVSLLLGLSSLAVMTRFGRKFSKITVD